MGVFALIVTIVTNLTTENKTMKRLEVLTDKGWKFVFCRNRQLAEPVTTATRAKAIPAHKHSMSYFRRYYSEYKFRYSVT